MPSYSSVKSSSGLSQCARFKEQRAAFIHYVRDAQHYCQSHTMALHLTFHGTYIAPHEHSQHYIQDFHLLLLDTSFLVKPW